MSLGSCCYIEEDELKDMDIKSVSIEGVQNDLIVNFEVTQTFKHQEKKEKEIHYVFPNDLKICIYGLTFVVGDEIIIPVLKSKKEAKKTYDEAVEDGYTVVYGSNVFNGLTEFKLGNVPPNTECKVILKIAFTAQLTQENNFFIKFPLDIYTPSGSLSCLSPSSNFSFKIQGDIEKVSNITSNILNGTFDKTTKTFTISNTVQHQDGQKSIIVTFSTSEKVQSKCLYAPSSSNGYDGCALIISPQLPQSIANSEEFIFVVDCSGSMSGNSIKKASECLELFVRSLPPGTFFNIIRFGSNYEKLFPSSVEYNDETCDKAIDCAKHLEADLGCTDLNSPLTDVFGQKNEHGQRQIFILTDGEVDDPYGLLQIILENSNNNRCFSIGIGRGCDAGLVEGIASSSGGKSDFVQIGDSISDKVIPQLNSSLLPSFSSIEVHIENDDTFEISPFPIKPISSGSSAIAYLREKKKPNSFDGGILITGNYGKETIEIPIEKVERMQLFDKDQFGCNEGKNLGDAILALFSFSYIKSLEMKRNKTDEDIAKIIETSVSSGVLSSYTGYVGMKDVYIKSKPRSSSEEEIVEMAGGCDDLFGDCCYACCESGSDIDDEECNNRICYAPEPESYDDICCAPCEIEKDDGDDNNNVVNLISITQYQKSSGFWSDLKALNDLLRLNIQQIEGIHLDDKVVEEKCVATVLAIAALRVKLSNEKNSWLMIERKAINWLNSSLPNVDIENIIAQTEKLIQA